MANPEPLLDGRTEKEISLQVEALMKTYLEDWPEFQPQAGVSGALIGIFSRYASLMIQRLNQAPRKNFLAFLDLLGASLLPPEPARVPLTFSLAPGSTLEAIVRAGTQVAALPREGESEPVIYETERELAATAARLVHWFIRDPLTDRYAEFSGRLAEVDLPGVSAFGGERPVDHILYVGNAGSLSFPSIQELQVQVKLAKNLPQPPDARLIQWELWDGAQSVPLTPASDGASNLTKSGVVVFRDLPAFGLQTIAGVESRWLRARLLTPISTTQTSQVGMVRQDHLPELFSVALKTTITQSGSSLETAFSNLTPLDLSKDFYPFGEKPKYGDALYLASKEVFSQSGAKVTLHFEISSSDSGIKLPVKDDLRKLRLECWDGAAWVAPKDQSDGTNAFTQTGDFSFTLIDPVKPTDRPIGLLGYWIRIRLSAGNFGKEAYYTPVYDPIDKTKITDYQLTPDSYTPPSIARITAGFVLAKSWSAPEQVLVYNDFRFTAPVLFPLTPYKPFQAMGDPRPAFYLGFALPLNRTSFPNSPLSLYFHLAEVFYSQVADNPLPAAQPRLTWEYWNGADWTRLIVNDETDGLSHSGTVELLPPADFRSSAEFGQNAYWLRVRWESGEFQFNPRLRNILINTTMAAQTVTITGEVLGSSNGGKNQIFRTTRAPVLKNQRLQVREPDLPPEEEQKRIESEEGKDAVAIINDETGRPLEIWVRWHQTPDFFASGSRDRHYVLDQLTGEIRFGDGVNGRIPPVGAGNILMERYRTGGGLRGNRPAGEIVQLKTTVPYIDRVINTIAASGGAEPEALDSLIDRAPRTVRHRGRAVTIEDYADLAQLASPEVARSRAVPLYDLAVDPDATTEKPGVVSLIIVPRSTEPKPSVGLELIERVKSYLNEIRIATADLVVVGPDYVRVDVEAEIALTAIHASSAVELAAHTVLAKYLHPLTGGLSGAGWPFGRQPHASDIYVLLEALPGVDHIRSLKLTAVPDRPGGDQNNRFLVYAGSRTITCVFEEG